jgi:membrane fusion protein (multidrug efflux system)
MHVCIYGNARRRKDEMKITDDSRSVAETSDAVPAQTGDGGHSAAPSGRFQTTQFRAVLAAITLLVVAAGVMFWLHWRVWESTDDAQIDGHIYPVSARVAGRITKVLVEDGQFVKGGDVLLRIDPSEYQLAVDQAEAEYRDAQAMAEAARLGVSISKVGSDTQISGASADVVSAEAGVAAAQENEGAASAQLTEAQATARKLNADVQRYRPLLEKQEIAEQLFDQAVTNAEAASAMVAARQAALAAAREQVRQAEARRAQAKSNLTNAGETVKQVMVTTARSAAAQAQVIRAKAALEQAKLNLQYTVVVAPVAGIVGRRSAEAGQNVLPNEDLFAIVPVRELWVTANFKETQLGKMRPEQTVRLQVDTYGGREWHGHVGTIGGATGARYSLLPPENATGNYVKVVQRVPVRIEFDDANKADFNRDGMLRPGMSVVPHVKVR